MDVRLSPEQVALRDSAASLVDRLGVLAVGELDDADRAAKLDAAVDASGWRELRVPIDEGGSPLASGVEVAIVAEELARRAADVAFVGPILAAELRRLAGAPASEARETVAMTADLASAAPCADGAVAIDAAGSHRALVPVEDDGSWSLGEAEVGEPFAPVDLTRAVAPVAGPVVPLADQARPLSADDLMRWTALGLAIACADLVGTMRGAVALSCDYARERRQYGVPVGSFQAVQHLLADAHVATEGSYSAALHAAWAVDALAPTDALAAASVAKAYAARAARSVCETAIQVHGGIGNTWECLAHVHLRRALLSTDLFGGVGPSLARVLAAHGVGVDGKVA